MDESLTGALAAVARQLAGGGDVVENLHELVERAAAHLPDADAWAFLGTGAVQRALVTSNGAVGVHDLPDGEGPCTDAVRTGEEIRADSPEELQARWGVAGAHLVAAGYQAVHAIPLGANGATVGSLLIARRCAQPLDHAELEAARAFAALASVGLSIQHSEEVTAQLQHALDARVTVEQAKGVVSATLGVPVGDALGFLRRHARTHNLRLADLADDVVRGTVSPADLC